MALLHRIPHHLRCVAGTLRSLRTVSTFKFADLVEERTKTPGPLPDWNALKFGHHFSDHMLTVEWKGNWSQPHIRPFGPLAIHPAAKALHYAVQLFEGMKAYLGVDGRIRLFRPELNMIRMNSSSERLGLAPFDGQELLKCLARLIEVDRRFVPSAPQSSLYIRPTYIGTEPTLGVTTSNEALLFVVVGPVGPYFPTGFRPVTLLADTVHVRAHPGGCGGYKLGANYGPTVYPAKKANDLGAQQILWLYGEDRLVTEAGTMNTFMLWEAEDGRLELVTPPLESHLILPGVTRQSILDLTRRWNEFRVVEKNFTMGHLVKALRAGRVRELFGAGTACVVCPIERILYEGQRLDVPTMKAGAPLTNRLLKELSDIQYGRVSSEWAPVIC